MMATSAGNGDGNGICPIPSKKPHCGGSGKRRMKPGYEGSLLWLGFWILVGIWLWVWIIAGILWVF
jgi:hypothetical protein